MSEIKSFIDSFGSKFGSQCDKFMSVSSGFTSEATDFMKEAEEKLKAMYGEMVGGGNDKKKFSNMKIPPPRKMLPPPKPILSPPPPPPVAPTPAPTPTTTETFTADGDSGQAHSRPRDRQNFGAWATDEDLSWTGGSNSRLRKVRWQRDNSAAGPKNQAITYQEAILSQPVPLLSPLRGTNQPQGIRAIMDADAGRPTTYYDPAYTVPVAIPSNISSGSLDSDVQTVVATNFRS